MAEDTDRARAVLFGGFDQFDVLRQDTWEWDGIAWTELVTQRSPEARREHAIAYDPDRDRIVLFGGEDASPEVWELHTDPDQRAGIELAFDWSALGVEPSALRILTVRATTGGQGYADAASTTGAELAIWNARLGRWDALGSNVAPSSTPLVIERTLSSAAVIGTSVTWENEARFLLRPRAGIGRGPGTSEVVADGAELRVTYEFPD
jgi:hypothetical protein